MKRNTRILLALCLACAPVIGCKNDVLSTAPTDQLSDAVFWKQPNDAVLAVNAIYPLLSGWDPLFYDAATDNGWAQKTFDGWYDIGAGTMDANSGTANGIWRNAYRAIRRANEVLANIDKIPKMDSTLKLRLEGEARFHRAYHYNELASFWGDVPLILEPIDIAEGTSATRTPKDKVVDQVLADCDFAAGVLPVSYSSTDQGRATRGAALALKARAALFAGRWQVAADAAKAVMDLGVYSLYPDYGDLFRYAGANNPNDKEIIYADQRLQGFRAQSAFSTFGPRSLQGGSEVVPLRSLVDAYLMVDGQPTSTSPLYDPNNPYANRDPRMYATLLYPGATFAGETFNSLPYQNSADAAGHDFNATATGFQFIKYVDPADKSNPTNSGINLIVMRYAEVLLTYVEAKVELGQVDQSVIDAFNQVRSRAGMPTVTNVTRDMVRLERRVEFAGEGLRLFDIRRWKLAETVMPGQAWGASYTDPVDPTKIDTIPGPVRHFTAPRDYLWPIPLAELNLNPGLGQNPGY